MPQRSFVLAIAVALMPVAALAAAPPALAMPAADVRAWREDLRFMAQEMERTHKNLYHAVTREKFAGLVADLDARIPSLDRAQVIVGLARIVAAVGDGHTNLYPTRDPKVGFTTLPVVFTFFGDSLYVRAARDSTRALLGLRVVRIGDRDVAGAYAAVKSIIGRDNEQGARYWAPYLLAMPEVLQALGVTSTRDRVPLTLEGEHGPVTATLAAYGPVEIMSGDVATLFDRRPGWTDVRDPSGRPDPLWLRDTAAVFRWEHVGDLLYVQLNQVKDGPDETLARFAARLHEEIASTRPARVALDLRLDRGGDGTLLVPLVRAFIRSDSVDCKGRFFALIGPATFSAAQMCVDALEKYTNVTFVGEPTGGKGNAFGDSRKIVLPHSGITVRVSIYDWQDWHPADPRDATAPEIPAPLTFEAYRNGVDPALEAVLQAPRAPCVP